MPKALRVNESKKIAIILREGQIMEERIWFTSGKTGGKVYGTAIGVTFETYDDGTSDDYFVVRVDHERTVRDKAKTLCNDYEHCPVSSARADKDAS